MLDEGTIAIIVEINGSLKVLLWNVKLSDMEENYVNANTTLEELEEFKDVLRSS